MNSWEWQDRHLLVYVKNGAANLTFLLKRMSQDEFMEAYIAFVASEYRGERVERYTTIIEMTVTDLSEDSYDMLEPFYAGKYKMEG